MTLKLSIIIAKKANSSQVTNHSGREEESPPFILLAFGREWYWHRNASYLQIILGDSTDPS